MKRTYALVAALGFVIASLALPMSAVAFQVTGGGGTQTQNPWGMWYAGKEACAQEGCHWKIASQPSPHSNMVTDVRAQPSKLEPAADSSFWPYSSALGGITLRPRDIYLQVGDGEGFHEYIGPEASSLATKVVPADDLPVWDPMLFLVEENIWRLPTAPIANRVYGQSCSTCHNVGATRPGNATVTLANGATQTTATPTTVSEFGVQCEACHGSGKNPNGHKNGVPGVVGGYQVLKSQVCGQCHVTGTASQKNVSGSAFGNPNGFSTDATLSAFFTPTTVVETEGAFMRYVNGQTATKPKFLPNGADYSMRHSYYNEWLNNKAPSGYGGDHGHADPQNEAVKLYVGTYGYTACLKCHSGLGFLNRIDAKAPNGTRIVPTYPTYSTVATADPGISCQVCHSGHVAYAEGGGYDSIRRWGNGKKVSCGDCHNWQFEMLGSALQYETINGKEYSRPAVNQVVHHGQRELYTGGEGGEDGLGGLWGVAPMGQTMPDVECNDCHMPRTHREDMPANDDGSTAETRMSHRFHIVEPGDAARWKLRPMGDSCRASCHKDELADYAREDFQSWIDQQRSAVASASQDATVALNAVATSVGLADWSKFIAAQPTGGPAAALPASQWAMLQHAAQNVNFVQEDGSGGVHNPAYALAGLAKSLTWARSVGVSIDATIGDGPALGDGMTVSGTMLGFEGATVPSAALVLETSTDGSAWSTVATTAPAADGAFSIPTGRIVGARIFRVRFTPSTDVNFYSVLMPVSVPVTTVGVSPAVAGTNWTNAVSADVTLSATPGSLTFYTLTGATVAPVAAYTGPITVSNEGATYVHFWSTDGSGVEATQTQQVLLDRGAPSVFSDVKAVYSNSATVHVWSTDAGSGVATASYALGGTAHDVDGDSFSFTTYTLGKNAVPVTFTDAAGKSTSTTLTVWVKASPKLTMSPSGTKTITRGKSVKFSTMATRGTDGEGHVLALTGRPLLLQRWTGTKWVTVATRSTLTGAASYTRTFSTAGTSYWRWRVNADTYTNAANSSYLKVVVK